MSVLLTLLCLTITALARPATLERSVNETALVPSSSEHHISCLNPRQVHTLLNGYAYLLECPQGADFNATADLILSDQFFVSSDSINTLAGMPLGVNAYASKQAFINGQSETPPMPVISTLGVFYTCDRIAWRWNTSSIGNNTYWVKGMITMDVDASNTQINAVYSEFNTAAWLADIGRS